MSALIVKALKKEIARREDELKALRQAAAALGSVGAARVGRGAPGKKRKPKTEEQKQELSRKMKAAWKRRKAAEAKEAG